MGFFNGLNKVWSGLDFWDKDENKRQRDQELLRNTRAQQALQQQEQKQGVKKPKQSAANKVRDIFDANTDADKYRRQMAGRPASYSQEQELLRKNNVQSVATNPIRRIGEEITDPYRRLAIGVLGAKNREQAQQALTREQQYMTDNMVKAMRKLRDPNVSQAEKMRWYNYVVKEYANNGQRDAQIRTELERYVKDVDPIAGAAAVGEIGLDIATLGAGGVVLRGTKNAAKQGSKELTRYLAKNAFKPMAIGAAGGATGVVTSQGSDATPGQVATGALAGASLAAVFPALGVVWNKLARNGADPDVIISSITRATTKEEISQLADKELGIKISDEAAEALAKTEDDTLIKSILDAEAKNLTDDTSKIADSVVQYIDKETGKKYFQTIADTDFNTVKKLIDDEQTSVAGKNIDSRIYHITAKTPEQMRKLGFEDAGQFKLDSPEVNTIRGVAGEQLSDQQKVELNQIARRAGYKDYNELINSDKKVGASNIADDIPEPEIRDVLKNALNYNEAPETAQRSILQTLSPDRLIRENVTRPLEEGANKLIAKAQQSSNPISRSFGRLFTGFNREAGRTAEQLAARRKFLQGSSQYGQLAGGDISKGALGDLTEASRNKIWAHLDPEQAAKKGLKLEDLTPDEQAALQLRKNIIDDTTQKNLDRGLITAEQAANPNYATRAYDIFDVDSEFQKAYKDAKTNLLGQYKGRKDVSEEVIDAAITDPDYLIAKKTAQSNAAWGMVDYANYLESSGIATPIKRPGYVQLPQNKLYGKAKGMYVPRQFAEDFTGFQYSLGISEAFNDLLTAYDSLGIRKAKKALLTVYNPAVRFGNQFSNRVIFSNFNGINPVQFNAKYAQAGKMIKNRNPYYIEAVEEGLTGTDILSKEFAQRLDGYTDANIAQKANDWIKKSYSAADDKARFTAYVIHRERGYTRQQAAQMVQRGFQDYSSVGFFYDLAAKTPIIGNAFVRFAGDAVRIAKNGALDHPLRSAATIALWANFVNGMSRLSGESPEDKATREGRFGAPQIPFTDISLAVQTPWGELNAARFIPMYALNDVGNDFTRFLPAGQNPLSPEGWQDPLLGQVGQLLTDTDFRGKSIQDPTNTTYDSQGNVKKYTELSGDEKRNNVLRFLFNQNIPLGREADSIRSAATGQPDIYGKERSVPQAVARAMGIKVEQFGPEQAEKQRSTDKYFEGNVERTNQFLKQNPDLEQAYFTFNNPTRDRDTNQKVSNLVSPERWSVVKSDSSGRLFNFLQQEAQTAKKENGKPLDPIFDLPTPEQQRQVLDLRSRPTGDDIETEEILRATQPWYKKFEEAERKYYDENSAYYDKLGLEDTRNDRVKEYGEIPYPEQSERVKKYYEIKAQDPDAAKAYFKNNADALSADFDKYRQERLKYINAKREIEGYPPIDNNVFANVTFGYEDDERKVYNELAYGKGYGGFGFGSGGSGNSYTLGSGNISNQVGQSGKKIRQIKAKQVIPTQNNVYIPKGQAPRKINIKSLGLPNSLPTFDSTKGRG